MTGSIGGKNDRIATRELFLDPINHNVQVSRPMDKIQIIGTDRQDRREVIRFQPILIKTFQQIKVPTGYPSFDLALTRAVADARARAELYAHAAHVKVGKVISISEQAAYIPSPQPFMREMSAMAASAVPVATGEQEVAATVHIVYELVDLE